MKRTPFKRRSQLRPKARLRPVSRALRRKKPHVELVVEEREHQRLWLVGMPRRCAVCPAEGGTCDGRVQGHHVVSKQAMCRRCVRPAVLWDRRNRLPVCERRHMQHESGFRRIPRAVVPVSAEEFAVELGLGWLLDRVYGLREEALCEPNA